MLASRCAWRAMRAASSRGALQRAAASMTHVPGAKARSAAPNTSAPQHGGRILTLPNAISAGRIASAPLVAHLVVSGRYGAALGVLTAAGLSDALDGWLARRWDQRSALGSVLDPLGDKAIALCVATSYAHAGLIPVSLAALVIARDAGMLAVAVGVRWRSLMRHFSGRSANPAYDSVRAFADTRIATPTVRPNMLGKANTVVQLVVFVGTLVAVCVPGDWAVAAPISALVRGLQAALAFTTVASSAAYVRDYRRVVSIART